MLLGSDLNLINAVTSTSVRKILLISPSSEEPGSLNAYNILLITNRCKNNAYIILLIIHRCKKHCININNTIFSASFSGSICSGICYLLCL